MPASSSNHNNHHTSSTPTNGPTMRGTTSTTPPPSGSHDPSSSAAATLPPLSLSILGVEPLDEFIKEVADFVHHMIATRPAHLGGAVEVEMKVGSILEKGSGGRLNMPVRVETVLEPGVDIRFESNLTSAQHKNYNDLLNNLLAPTSPAPTPTPLTYTHLHLLDTFYATPDAAFADMQGGDRIRVTRDEKTGAVVQCVRKVRLGDLNVFSPRRSVDWRVSVNLEVPVAHPLGSPQFSRRKDRMRYTHEEFVIDLTQVSVLNTPTGPPTKTLHELELEIARPELLLATAAKRNDISLSEHERSAFDELIRAFVNNARILVRNASTP